MMVIAAEIAGARLAESSPLATLIPPPGLARSGRRGGQWLPGGGLDQVQHRLNRAESLRTSVDRRNLAEMLPPLKVPEKVPTVPRENVTVIEI